jgi:hypothetical protein
MQEVKEITSVSRAGESLVKVEAKLAFAHPAELDPQVWDKLRSKIAEVSRAAAGRRRAVVKGDFDVFALFYAVTGDGYTPRQLYDYADFLRRELVLVPGVARVALLGERKERCSWSSRARAAQFGSAGPGVRRCARRASSAGRQRAGRCLHRRSSPRPRGIGGLKSLVVAGDAEWPGSLEDIADIRGVHHAAGRADAARRPAGHRPGHLQRAWRQRRRDG